MLCTSCPPRHKYILLGFWIFPDTLGITVLGFSLPCYATFQSKSIAKISKGRLCKLVHPGALNLSTGLIPSRQQSISNKQSEQYCTFSCTLHLRLFQRPCQGHVHGLAEAKECFCAAQCSHLYHQRHVCTFFDKKQSMILTFSVLWHRLQQHLGKNKVIWEM